MHLSIDRRHRAILGAAAAALLASACGAPPAKTDADYRSEATRGMHDVLEADLDALVDASGALEDAAPSQAWRYGDPGWREMNAAWIEARHDYEHAEGATAPLFPDFDRWMDGRIEDFGPGGLNTLSASSDMFGTQAMTGLHAIERILYADPDAPYRTDFDHDDAKAIAAHEAALGFIPPAAFPATDAEALELKQGLCARLASDASALRDAWKPDAIDVREAYRGLLDLLEEQGEKVIQAGLRHPESRYSERTMDDLRQNLAGTMKAYAVFRAWIRSKPGGPDLDIRITAGFQTLEALYADDAYAGPAMPEPPEGWSNDDPSPDHLKTPFGRLYQAVTRAVDTTRPGSVAFEMAVAGRTVGLSN